jgi:hypothetical protein
VKVVSCRAAPKGLNRRKKRPLPVVEPNLRTHLPFSVAAALVLLACSKAHPSAAGGTTAPSAPEETPGTVSVTPGAGAGSPSSAVPEAGSPSDSDAAADGGTAPLGPPVDAPVRPPGHDDLCNISPAGWWTTTASIDSAVSSAAFANAMNALFTRPNAHPLTLAAYTEGGAADWTFKATGSLTNGIGQQYFPFDHPATPATAARSTTSIGTSSPQASAFLHVVDGANEDLWLPLSAVDVHATVPDSSCANLEGGVLTATVSHTAGVMSMTLSDGPMTNLGGLLGAEAPGGGWPLRMTFDAEKVQITLK